MKTSDFLFALNFASEKHKFQKRKGEFNLPYINHPIRVANYLSEAGENSTSLLIAALLHDVLEDTDTSSEEIEKLFGKDILNIVLEVTDDKSLTKEVRKQKQIDEISKKSQEAKLIKIADKIDNVYDIAFFPPDNWSVERKLEYADWAEKVVKNASGVNEKLEAKFFETLDLCKSKIYPKQNL